ncbi:MAG: lytic murein transglycosylase [Pseudomonadota bacterium]|nr:lytic murein transglycosylase [Pseudomonadota bacterium]
MRAETFDVWLKGLRHEARGQGISEATLDMAFADVSPIARVIELDRKQPEWNMTFDEYRARIVSRTRVVRGRELLLEHWNILEPISREYGVPARFIVALWGIETNYGSNTGGYSVIAALATLAHDGRRSAFFRKELLNALNILEEGHISQSDMTGSWAGAMGQSQFMPSSFNAYAIDGNEDGRTDIWTSLPDVFASAANYLKKNGWTEGQTWGRHIVLPKNFEYVLATLGVKKSLAQWQKLGVRRPGGAPLPKIDMTASIIMPDGQPEHAFLVYDNYRTILRWNRSTYFASSVGLLADMIGWPK